MSSPVFVLFGSGPGIGIALAKVFAKRHFDTVVLCARNADRLAAEKADVENVARTCGRNVQVHALQTDLTNLKSLKETLQQIEQLGPLGCVFHNAARLNFADPLSVPAEEVEEDFKTGAIALYAIAQWAVPLLQNSKTTAPSFFVTNSLLPEHPLPILLSLSAVKASQQNIIVSLHQAFGKDIHFGLIKVMGEVAPENANLNPTNIAEKAAGLYEQGKADWAVTVEIAE